MTFAIGQKVRLPKLIGRQREGLVRLIEGHMIGVHAAGKRVWFTARQLATAAKEREAELKRIAANVKDKTLRPMTDEERTLASMLQPGVISYPVGSSHKRFAGEMFHKSLKADAAITEKQAEFLLVLKQRYRRQLP